MEQLLRQADIQVNDGDEDGDTPLILAAGEGHAKVVELLLGKQDIQVNLVDGRGISALVSAAFHGHDEVVRLLLQKDGIQVDQWALVNAADKRHGKIVEMLLRRPEIRATPYNGWRPHRRISNQAARVRLPIGHSGPRRSYV